METVEMIKKAFGNSSDLIVRPFYWDQVEVTLVECETLTSSTFVNEYILQRLTRLTLTPQNKETALFNLLPNNSITILNDVQQMYDYICKGFALLVYDEKKAMAIEAKADLDRGIGQSDSESTVRGSKDAFNENFNTNVGLIRRRIRSEHCYLDSLYIGKQTRTKIGIMYMNTIVESKNVDTIKSRLQKINTDGILDSGALKGYLEDKHNFFFPTVMATERPDKVSQALLEGKIAVIADNSPYVLLTPSFFVDYLHASDDYYQKSFNISFLRILRFLAFLISIFVPAIYIAVTTHNQDAIPLNLLLNFTNQRQSVPFSALVEALFMSISFEILRESDIRKPAAMGSAVSILGGLILGDAAVAAGIISPIMIIVISISAISGLAFSSMEMIAALRSLRFLMMVLAMFFGVFGIYCGGFILLASLSTTSTLSLPYLAPVSPFIKEEIGDSIIKTKRKKVKKRNPLLTKNTTRGRDV